MQILSDVCPPDPDLASVRSFYTVRNSWQYLCQLRCSNQGLLIHGHWVPSHQSNHYRGCSHSPIPITFEVPSRLGFYNFLAALIFAAY
jgi:hypothetical protein